MKALSSIGSAAVGACLAAALVLAACGEPVGSPQARIRSMIAAAEESAESRDISGLGERVSDDYHDAHGYDRRTVLRIAQGLFLRNREIHLLTVVRDLEVNDAAASAGILVAMTGRPVESVDALLDVRAELVRFDIELVREGDEWLVRAADWRRAELKDFL